MKKYIKIETGSYPSTYISTSASTVTRPADTYASAATTVFDRDGGNKEAPLNPKSFSIYSESEVILGGFFPTTYSVVDSANLERIRKYFYHNTGDANAGRTNLRIRVGNSYPHNVLFNDGTGDTAVFKPLKKAVVAAETNNARSALNSVLSVPTNTLALWDITGAGNTKPVQFRIGTGDGNSNIINSPIRRITCWRTRLPNVALTNITEL